MGIRVITAPKVYVIGRQSVDESRLAEFLADEGVDGWSTDAASGGEKLIEIGGRLCYMSFAKPRPGGNAGYIGHILEVGHGSVLEHAVWTLLISGVSRSLTHELIRHRVGISPSQLSQRYVDETDVAFVVPPALLQWHVDEPRWLASEIPWHSGYYKIQSWRALMGDCLRLYRVLADELEKSGAGRKAAREAARSVLPNATETKIQITANARALRHFIEMRGSVGADAEMRRLAREVLGVMVAEAPVVFGDFAVGEDGSIASTWHKV